jgi:hypothetical protein
MSDSNDGTRSAVAEVAGATDLAKTLSLFQIEESLVLLAESSEASGLTPEIEGALAAYLKGAVEKRDRVAEFIRFCESMAELAKAEAKRLRARQKHFEAAAERVSSMVLHVLDWLGAEKLEGRTSTLKKRKCPPSVNVIDEQKIPAEYKRVTVTLPLPQWQQLLDGIPEGARNTVLAGVRKQEISLDLEAIKQALSLEKAIEGADLALDRFKLQVS